MRRTLLVVSVLLAIINPAIAQAEEKSWHFDEWHTQLTINDDGSVDVIETTVVDFTGSFSWITRSIARQGGMEISNVRVMDLETEQLLDSIDITETGYSTDVTIYHTTVDDTRQWAILYTADNVINNFPEHDELYWNSVSDDRDVPIEYTSATVLLPQPVDPELLQLTTYGGAYGTQESAGEYAALDGQTLYYEDYNIPPYANFTIVAGFPKGLVPDPPRVSINSDQLLEQYTISENGVERRHNKSTLFVGEDIPAGTVQFEFYLWGHISETVTVDTPLSGTTEIEVTLQPTWWYELGRLLLLFIGALYVLSPLPFFVVMYVHWRGRGKDPRGRATTIPQYETYQGLTPGVVGTLYDEQADLQDITATLIDLAVRGYIRIEQHGDEEFSFTLLKAAYAEDSLVQKHERELLQGVFGATAKKSATVQLEDLKYSFMPTIAAVRQALYDETVAAKLFVKDPAKVRARYRATGIILIAVGSVGMFLYFAGLPVILYGIIVLLFSQAMPRKTRKGVEAFEWVEGFRTYLHHAERYRVAQQTPQHFERMLPYAIVFGVEKEWAAQFADLYNTPPTWFTGQWGNDFSAVLLTEQLSDVMLPATTSAITAVRSSSSYGSGGFGSASGGSSGFSGGGFSGGGFGGGGSSAG